MSGSKSGINDTVLNRPQQMAAGERNSEVGVLAVYRQPWLLILLSNAIVKPNEHQ
ncbi:TPA: hypothetical protein MYO83_002334 [Klebsiella michiganensis]|nr:hypothetical protein [Klebsiella michiganensis]HCB1845709.1 hypothetical protein [Klebsiella oxytoca]